MFQKRVVANKNVVESICFQISKDQHNVNAIVLDKGLKENAASER